MLIGHLSLIVWFFLSGVMSNLNAFIILDRFWLLENLCLIV